MELLFSLVQEKEMKKDFPNSKLSARQLFNNIGLAHFHIVHYGKIRLEFDNMLIGTILDLASNYYFVKAGINKIGALYKMEGDWETNLKFVFENGKFFFTLENGKKLLISDTEFLLLLEDFSNSSYEVLESRYPTIIDNKYYQDVKNKVAYYLKQ